MPDAEAALALCYRRTGSTTATALLASTFSQGPLLASAGHLIHIHLTFVGDGAGWPAKCSHGEDSMPETHGRGAGAAAVSIDNQSAIASLDGEHGCRERVSTRCAPSSTLVCGCRRPIVKAQDPWDGISHEPPAQLSSTRRQARASVCVCVFARTRARVVVVYLVTSQLVLPPYHNRHPLPLLPSLHPH